MEELTYRILRRRQLLRDILNQAYRTNPVHLDVVKKARIEMFLLNAFLEEINVTKKAV